MGNYLCGVQYGLVPKVLAPRLACIISYYEKKKKKGAIYIIRLVYRNLSRYDASQGARTFGMRLVRYVQVCMIVEVKQVE